MGEPPRRSYRDIASINTAVRNKRNVIEVKLEKAPELTDRVQYKVSPLEMQSLLSKLSLTAEKFSAIQACPEGRPVIYITLADVIIEVPVCFV